jgi:hypothetical protein
MGLPALLRLVQIASGDFGNPDQATEPLPPKNAGQTGMASRLWLPWMYRDAYPILYRKGEVSKELAGAFYSQSESPHQP